MAINTDVPFSRRADVQWVSIINVAANTATDGTGTVSTIWTADATEGGLLSVVTIKPVTHTGSNNVANVARFFINNGSTNATASNNSFIGEVGLIATTGVAAAAVIELSFPVNKVFPPGYKLNVCLGTTVGAGLGWYFTGWGATYQQIA
jgi:hypothetical protein